MVFDEQSLLVVVIHCVSPLMLQDLGSEAKM